MTRPDWIHNTFIAVVFGGMLLAAMGFFDEPRECWEDPRIIGAVVCEP